jgi:hypothetical protein
MRETLADWLMAIAGPILVGSLFLTWSHQFSGGFLARYGGSSALQGVPRTPDAWQVYSAADILLAVVGTGLFAVALWGGRTRRVLLALAVAVALAFTLHALGTPPTNGAVVFDAAAGAYARDLPASGTGETLAVVALCLGAAGLTLSFTVPAVRRG